MLGESNGRRGGESVEEQGGVDVGEILMMPPGASGELVFMAGDEGVVRGKRETDQSSSGSARTAWMCHR